MFLCVRARAVVCCCGLLCVLFVFLKVCWIASVCDVCVCFRVVVVFVCVLLYACLFVGFRMCLCAFACFCECVHACVRFVCACVCVFWGGT